MAKVWLCRNAAGKEDCVIGPLEDGPVKDPEGYWYQPYLNGGTATVSLCAKDFHRLFPHLEMEPGDGPRKVEFIAKFCE